MNIEKIREEYREHKEKYLYMMKLEFSGNETYLSIDDVDPSKLSWAEFMTNFTLYHKSIEDCLDGARGTRDEIIYHGENINPIKESIFISFNPYTGEYYKEYIY